MSSLTTEALLGAMLSGSTNIARLEEAGAAVLARFGTLDAIASATSDDLETELSMGESAMTSRRSRTARALATAFELGRRAGRTTPAPEILDATTVAAWAEPRIGWLEHEELWLLALDGRSRLRAARCVGRGGLHGMSVRPCDPLRLAIRSAASAFVLVHNHPSGDPTPSADDVRFTARIATAAALCDVPLLDHVVVSRDGFASVPIPSASTPLASLDEGWQRPMKPQ